MSTATLDLDRLRSRIYWTEKRLGPLTEGELLHRLSQFGEPHLLAWAAALSGSYPWQWDAATADSRQLWPVWCSWCRTIIHMHGPVRDSHGICPDCARRELQQLRANAPHCPSECLCDTCRDILDTADEFADGQARATSLTRNGGCAA